MITSVSGRNRRHHRCCCFCIMWIILVPTGFIQFFQNIYLSIHYMQDTLLGAGETLVNQADIVPAFWSLTVLRLMYLTPAGNLLCSPYFSLPILKMEQQQKADLLLLSGGEALQGASRELFQACSEPRDHWAWET